MGVKMLVAVNLRIFATVLAVLHFAPPAWARFDDGDDVGNSEIERLRAALAMDPMEVLKRSSSWAALHNTWGKRGAAGWNNLQGAWGKRSDPDGPEYEEYSSEDPAYVDEDYDQQASSHEMIANGPAKPKRGSWNDMRPSWGKRSEGDRDWNSFRGAWGKRKASAGPGVKPRGVWGKRPSWKQLSMWGKRSGPKAWNQLSPGWGKRSEMDHDEDSLDNGGNVDGPSAASMDYDKRSSSWNKMTPMWGKRDQMPTHDRHPVDLESLADELEKRAQAGWNNLSGAWGKRSAGGTWKNLRGSWGKRKSGGDQHLMSPSGPGAPSPAVGAAEMQHGGQHQPSDKGASTKNN